MYDTGVNTKQKSSLCCAQVLWEIAFNLLREPFLINFAPTAVRKMADIATGVRNCIDDIYSIRVESILG